MDYAEKILSYQIATELWVNYNQKLDPNYTGKKGAESLSNYPIVEVNASNYVEMKKRYKKLDLPAWFALKNRLKQAVYVNVLSSDEKKVIASAEIVLPETAAELVRLPKNENYDMKKTFLNDVEVAKAYQGKGLGRQFVKYLIDKYNIGYLETFAEGEVARKLYQDLGFKSYEVENDDEVIFMKR